MDGLAILVSVMTVHPVERRLQMLLIQVAGGHHLAVLKLQKFTRVARTLHAPTNHSQGDAFGGGRLVAAPEGAGRNNRGQGNRCTGRGEKSATADSSFGGGGFHSVFMTPDSRLQIQY